jgi:hypothetical protein
MFYMATDRWQHEYFVWTPTDGSTIFSAQGRDAQAERGEDAPPTRSSLTLKSKESLKSFLIKDKTLILPSPENYLWKLFAKLLF